VNLQIGWYINEKTVLVAGRCKLWVYTRSVSAIEDWNPTDGMDVCLF